MSRSVGRAPIWNRGGRRSRLALAAGAAARAAACLAPWLAACLTIAASAGAQTVSSAANQTFVVSAAPTASGNITVTDAATATITAANDIRIRVPAGLNLTWDPTVTTVTITGTGAAKVSTTVSYANGNLDLVINVTTNFAGGNAIVVAGLRFANFTAVSAASRLGLIVGGAGGAVVDTDNRTRTIVAPTISSAANQSFLVAAAATTISTITITDASTASITAANDIRVRIPAALNMTWDPSVTTATIGGASAARVSATVSYANGNRDLVINVTTNFAAGGAITVAGLRFMSFTATSPATSLQLITGGAAAIVAATDNRTKTIVAPVLSSAADQVFIVGAAATAMSAITVTDAAVASITAANDIRIRIPAALNMTWDPTATVATFGGGAAAKASTTVSYANGNRDLVVNVTANFVAGDVITISGLRFASFTATSSATSLELVTGGAGGVVVATDDKTKRIVATSLSSAANQTFVVGAPATAVSPITITDATTPAITAANDIRIRIPAAFNMTCNTAVTTATISGGAAAKMSTAVTYEDAGKTVVLNVTTSFVGSDQITVSGLQFTSFTAISAAANLQLVVAGSGAATADLDDKSIVIGSAGVTFTPNVAAVSRLPSNAVTYTATGTLTNTGSVADSYDLLGAVRPGGALTFVSITGPGVTQGATPDSARLTGLAAGGVATITLTYSVGNVPVGTLDSLFVLARSVALVTAQDSVKLAVLVAGPTLTFSKSVAPLGTPPPGSDLTYTASVANVGSQSAVNVVLMDSLPGSVQFKLASVVTTMPAGVTAAVEFSNDAGATWIYVPTATGCGAPAGYDGCVRAIRWRLLSNLSSVPPDNTGSVQFVTRIP